MLGLITDRAGFVSAELLCSVCCRAVLTATINNETAVDGYNPALFSVLSVSYLSLEKLNFT